MRLTTDFWVSALLRRVFGQGGYAAIVSRGAAEAGAVFLVVRGRDGKVALYGPAAQASYGEDKPSERQFTLLSDDMDDEAVRMRMERERRFDPDLWVVELEPAGAAAGLFTLTSP